jgi:hypothetical protein
MGPCKNSQQQIKKRNENKKRKLKILAVAYIVSIRTLVSLIEKAYMSHREKRRVRERERDKLINV